MTENRTRADRTTICRANPYTITAIRVCKPHVYGISIMRFQLSLQFHTLIQSFNLCIEKI